MKGREGWREGRGEGKGGVEGREGWKGGVEEREGGREGFTPIMKDHGERVEEREGGHGRVGWKGGMEGWDGRVGWMGLRSTHEGPCFSDVDVKEASRIVEPAAGIQG